MKSRYLWCVRFALMVGALSVTPPTDRSTLIVESLSGYILMLVSTSVFCFRVRIVMRLGCSVELLLLRYIGGAVCKKHVSTNFILPLGLVMSEGLVLLTLIPR